QATFGGRRFVDDTESVYKIFAPNASASTTRHGKRFATRRWRLYRLLRVGNLSTAGRVGFRIRLAAKFVTSQRSRNSFLASPLIFSFLLCAWRSMDIHIYSP